MRNYSFKNFMIFILFFLIAFPSGYAKKSDNIHSSTFAYNAQKALDYAKDYYNKGTNIDGVDFRDHGVGDCAHFVSLCIGNLSEAIGLGEINKETAKKYGGGVTLLRPIQYHEVFKLSYFGGLPEAGMYYNGQAGAIRSNYSKRSLQCNVNLNPWLVQNGKADIKKAVNELKAGDIIIYGINSCWVHVDGIVLFDIKQKKRQFSKGDIVQINNGYNLRSGPNETSKIIGNSSNKRYLTEAPYTGIVEDVNGEWVLIKLDSMIRDSQTGAGGHAVLYIGDGKISDHAGVNEKTGFYGASYKKYIDDIAKSYAGNNKDLVSATFIHIKGNKGLSSSPPPSDPPTPPSDETCEIIVNAAWNNQPIDIKYYLSFNDNLLGEYTTTSKGSRTHSKMKPGKYSVRFVKEQGFYSLRDPKSGIITRFIRAGDESIFHARYDRLPIGGISIKAQSRHDSNLVVPFELVSPSEEKSNYQTPAEIKNLPVGDYTIHWKDIEGYYPDGDSDAIEVMDGVTRQVIKRYEEGERKIPGPSYIRVSATVHHKDEGKRPEAWSGFVDIKAERLNESGRVVETLIKRDLRVPQGKIDIQPGLWKIAYHGPTITKVVNGKVKQALFHIEPQHPIEIVHGGTGYFSLRFVYPEDRINHGTINVESNINGARFEVKGSSGFSGATPASRERCTVAAYTITWIEMEGYESPRDETLSLRAGATITFYGYYRQKSGGSPPPPTPPPPPGDGGGSDEVTLTLYVHENSTRGPILPGVQVKVTIENNSRTFTTNQDGFIQVNGKKGTWSFIASKVGYESNSWEQTIDRSETRRAFIKKNADGSPPPPPPGDGGGSDEVTLTLYVHENSTTGNVLPDVRVRIRIDGSSDTYMTDRAGKIVVKGKKGTWSFIASKVGYESNSWEQTINKDETRRAFIVKKSDDGSPPPSSNYRNGSWISIGPNCFYYDNPCGKELHRFTYENGYQIREQKYCGNQWWHKVYMYDDTGVKNQFVWIRENDINKRINAPRYNIGSTYEFKKGSDAYDRVNGSIINTIKYDGNKFKILDRVYRNNTWWYQVYVTPWGRNVWFKESSIL